MGNVHLKRRYGDGCGVAQALDVIGERWALLIVRDLLLGPKRFTDLQAGLPGAGPNILAQRLRDLENTGVVRRRTLPPPAGSRVYELTEWGAELDPIVTALGLWGVRSPVLPLEGEVGADSIMLNLRACFTPDERRRWTADYEVHIGRDRFTMRVVEGELVETVRGQAVGSPDAAIEADPETLDGLMLGKQTVAEAIDADRLRVTGSLHATQLLFDATLIA
ncbi:MULTISPECIES: winged helix-turn-helix transcriptional regulator [unclassified Saccharothrix]|uniref:winged helix-turn-helix transcriptional regulator n=1 Tax=unclassified Saccharothrix TaxID=2593673 RepID=UPI00307D4DB3